LPTYIDSSLIGDISCNFPISVILLILQNFFTVVWHLLYIIIGCTAFILFYIFDLNKIIFIHRYANICFLFGIVLISFCTIALLFGNFKNNEIPAFWQWSAGMLSFVSLLLMVYTLFMGIPFTKTYIETNKGNTVVNTGMYALCRHPGVIWFFFFYFFLGLASGKISLLWAAGVWTIMDIIYVYIQDRWIFTIILEDYQSYQKQVPFLIPDLISIRNCISSLRGNGN
jgi:protein-S-isoprenylcysteine O-methyltransferase Ste14